MKTKNTHAETKSSNMTTIKTSYARAAIVLLALNFCLTTYAVLALNNTTQEQIDNQSQVNESNTARVLNATQPNDQVSGAPEEPSEASQTRETDQ